MASYSYERDITPEDLIQETPPPLTPAQQRANWWHYHWYYVVLIAAALLAVGYFVWSRVTEVQPDYTVAVVSRTDPDTAFLSQLETQLEGLAEDVNGDGKVKVTVKGIWLALDFETQDAALQQLMQSSEDKLNSDFYLDVLRLGQSIVKCQLFLRQPQFLTIIVQLRDLLCRFQKFLDTTKNADGKPARTQSKPGSRAGRNNVTVKGRFAVRMSGLYPMF